MGECAHSGGTSEDIIISCPWAGSGSERLCVDGRDVEKGGLEAFGEFGMGKQQLRAVDPMDFSIGTRGEPKQEARTGE